MFTTRFLDLPPLTAAAGTVRLPGSKSISNRVLLLAGSANRDERAFADPDRYDLDRDRESVGIASFGVGRHFCLGAGLARLEAAVVLRTVASHEPSLRLDGPEPDRLRPACGGGRFAPWALPRCRASPGSKRG